MFDICSSLRRQSIFILNFSADTLLLGVVPCIYQRCFVFFHTSHEMKRGITGGITARHESTEDTFASPPLLWFPLYNHTSGLSSNTKTHRSVWPQMTHRVYSWDVLREVTSITKKTVVLYQRLRNWCVFNL